MTMMKGMLAGVVVLFSVSAAIAEEKAAPPAKPANAVMIPAADLKWSDVPNFPGLKMAVAKGDPMKGASHFFIKFPAAFAAPVHHHTADHSVVVLSGTLTLSVDGKDTKLPAGSFFNFTKKQKHGTTCDAGAECLIFVDGRGKWDVVVPTDKTKAAAPK